VFCVYVMPSSPWWWRWRRRSRLGWTLCLLLAAFAAGGAGGVRNFKLQLTRLRSGVSVNQAARLAADTMAGRSGNAAEVRPGLSDQRAGLLLLRRRTALVAGQCGARLSPASVGGSRDPVATVGDDLVDHRPRPTTSTARS